MCPINSSSKPKSLRSADPLRIQNAIEVIHLVLHDPRVEALDSAIDRRPVLIKSSIVQPAVTRHQTPHAGHRQASFPSLVHLLPQWRELRVDQHGVRNRRYVRVARVFPHLEDNDAQTDADLRRGDTPPHSSSAWCRPCPQSSVCSSDRIDLPEPRPAAAADVPSSVRVGAAIASMLTHQKVTGRARNSSVPKSISNPSPMPKLACRCCHLKSLGRVGL